MRTYLILLLSFAFFQSHIGATSPEKAASQSLAGKIVLTNEEGGLKPQAEFTCQGMIHGYLTFSKPVTQGTLEGLWRIPNGAVTEHSQVPLDFKRPGRRTAYLWLQFDDKSGGVLGASTDVPEKEKAYDGEWELEVRFNEEFLLKQRFKVKC